MDRQAVVRLIEQAAAEQWEELDLAGMDLAGMQLTELPPEIGQLRQLKRLILGKGKGCNSVSDSAPELGASLKWYHW